MPATRSFHSPFGFLQLVGVARVLLLLCARRGTSDALGPLRRVGVAWSGCLEC